MAKTEVVREVLSTKYEILRNTKYLSTLDIQMRALELAHGLAITKGGKDGDGFTAWYCKAYKTLGEGRYAAVATMARKGKNPVTLFGWMLKNEMKAKQARQQA